MPPLPRRLTALLVLLCTAAILVITVWPFRFRLDPAFTAARYREIDWSLLPAPEHESLFVDFALNVLLFLSFGAAAYLHRRAGAGTASSVLAATAAGAILSLSVETAQVWLPTRHPQVADVVSNAFGAFSGAAAVSVLEGLGARTSPAEIRRAATRGGGLLLPLALSLLPLVETVRRLDPVRSVPELETRAKAFLHSSMFSAGSLGNAVSAVLLAGLALSLAEWAMHSLSGLRSRFTYLPIFLLVSLEAVFLPFLQIFFRSRTPTWGFLLLGVSCGGIGILAHFLTRYGRFRNGIRGHRKTG